MHTLLALLAMSKANGSYIYMCSQFYQFYNERLVFTIYILLINSMKALLDNADLSTDMQIELTKSELH